MNWQHIACAVWRALDTEVAAAWVQAIFSVVAIGAAIWIARRQRADIEIQRGKDVEAAEKERQRAEREETRRLIAGLRAEIVSAMEAADRMYKATAEALVNREAALMAKRVVADPGPMRPGSATLTDAIIYRRIAAELGRLPPALITQIVGFYTAVAGVAQAAESGSSTAGGYVVLRDVSPRLRRNGAGVVGMLDKFARSGFAVDAALILDEADRAALCREFGNDVLAVPD